MCVPGSRCSVIPAAGVEVARNLAGELFEVPAKLIQLRICILHLSHLSRVIAKRLITQKPRYLHSASVTSRHRTASILTANSCITGHDSVNLWQDDTQETMGAVYRQNSQGYAYFPGAFS